MQSGQLRRPLQLPLLSGHEAPCALCPLVTPLVSGSLVRQGGEGTFWAPGGPARSLVGKRGVIGALLPRPLWRGV